ncbi:Gfo/Idh/MocA family protein [Sphingomonas sp. R86520]|uniref:Gfo/Idh/MocA family protein n=1 Tax=Sphingomonas sp. R86520 TaxID=3093859 RepID=UPI0036D400B6
MESSARTGAYAHRPAWESIDGVEVTAICTSRRETAEAASARLNIPRAFWNAEEMAADPDLDIIDIGTRPDLRHAMVLAALRNGKHVYNGIPMAKDIDDARDMHRAWQTAGTVCVADCWHRRSGGRVFAVDSRARQEQGNARCRLYWQAVGRKLPVQHGAVQSP